MVLVSIIIPTFNSEKYLDVCLNSVVNQTLKDIEIIVVDSASTDSTLCIVNNFIKKDGRIKLLKRKKEYVGLARNAALKEAKGKYIMFLDSDDWLEHNACEEAYNHISKNNNDMVFFDFYEYINNQNIVQATSSKIKNLSNYFDTKSFSFSDIKYPFINGAEPWYKIYKKSFLEENKIWFSDEKFGEDVPFFIACIVYAKSVSVLNKRLIYYRKTEFSAVSISTNYWEDIFTVREKAFDIIKSSPEKNFLNIFLPYYISSIIYWFENWSQNKKFRASSYYSKMKKLFKNLENIINTENIDLSQHLETQIYKKFKNFSKDNYILYPIKKYIQNIFSIKNNDLQHKVITLFGIKFKFKKSKKIINNKYKKISKLYDTHINKIKTKVKNKEKIRVAFFVNDSKWKCQNLFDLMKNSNFYHPFIIVGESSVGHYHFEHLSKAELNKIYEYYTSKGMETYKAYICDENADISLSKFNADIIFYSRPWCLHHEQNIEVVSEYALTCYIPYFISNSPAWLEANHKFHNLLWKYFVINKELEKEYALHMANYGKNLSVVGYPLLESYINYDEINNNKKFVIYAPHWSIGETTLKYATFDWNGHYILKYAKQHPEINWVFKPHPLLKEKIIQTGLMTQENVEAYYKEWDRIGIKYEGPDYLDLFKQSKLLITDCGSFLAEYMPTKMPVILLRSKKSMEYNFLAQKITKYYYKVYNLEELSIQLENVLIKEKDINKEKRIKILEDLNLITNASKNIINILNKEFGVS